MVVIQLARRTIYIICFQNAHWYPSENSLLVYPASVLCFLLYFRHLNMICLPWLHSWGTWTSFCDTFDQIFMLISCFSLRLVLDFLLSFFLLLVACKYLFATLLTIFLSSILVFFALITRFPLLFFLLLDASTCGYFKISYKHFFIFYNSNFISKTHSHLKTTFSTFHYLLILSGLVTTWLACECHRVSSTKCTKYSTSKSSMLRATLAFK